MLNRMFSVIAFLIVGVLGAGTAFYTATFILKKSSAQTEVDVAPPPPPPNDMMIEEEPAPQQALDESSMNGQVNDINSGNSPDLQNVNKVPASGLGEEQDSPSELNEEIGFLEPFIYQIQEGRRDPFRKPVYQTVGDGLAGGGSEPAGPLLPLQRFDLDEISLIGIMWDVADPKAMFKDPGNKIHIVGKDQRIGKNNGYIAVIREGEVVVVETARINGELTYTTRIKQLATRKKQ